MSGKVGEANAAAVLADPDVSALTVLLLDRWLSSFEPQSIDAALSREPH